MSENKKKTKAPTGAKKTSTTTENEKTETTKKATRKSSTAKSSTSAKRASKPVAVKASDNVSVPKTKKMASVKKTAPITKETQSTAEFIEDGFASFQSRLDNISLTINNETAPASTRRSKTKTNKPMDGDLAEKATPTRRTPAKKENDLKTKQTRTAKTENITTPVDTPVDSKAENAPNIPTRKPEKEENDLKTKQTRTAKTENIATPVVTPVDNKAEDLPNIPTLNAIKKETSSDIEKLEIASHVETNEENDDFEKTIIIKKITNDFDKPKPVKASVPKRLFSYLIIFIICIGLLIGGVGLGILSKIISTSPPLDLNDFTGLESSKVIDSDGGVITELGAYLRENVTYDDLPESVIDSFIAIEDSRFFTHPGFDLPRFSKAFIENIKAGSFAQGGSTFTMQLVKNTYFSIDDLNNSVVAEKSIDRKVQEIYLALKIETEFTKQEIFEKYLNKLNFGGNIRGIQKAAQYYFGKDISDVTLSESALLAGIINLPNKYNPYYFLDYAQQRRDLVLEMMYRHGYITANEADLAKAIHVEDLLIGEENTYNRTESQYQSYIDAVIGEAQTLTGKDPALTSMTIYTYMDRDVQETIDAIQDGSANIPFPDDLMQTAIVSMDNRTGAIVGIGGGRNYEGARLLNRATAGFKQPGSAVKPFLSYALAFEHLYWSNKHVLTDRPYTYRGSTLVLKNFDRKYRGDVLIDQALAQSLNIPAIDTLQQVIDAIGKEEVVKYMQTIGFSKVTLENFDISYAIGGSSFESTVVEMAGAHAMLINSGVYNKPHTIQKIVLQDGTVFYPDQQNVKVLSTGTSYLVDQLMKYAVDGPYYNYMQVLKRKYPIYAKTGTSDWGKDGVRYGIPVGAAKDKWMIASSTQFTNAVWIGYDKGVKDKGTYFNGYKSGLNLTGKISKLLMDTVEKTSTVEPVAIEKPNDIEDITYVLGSWPYAVVEDWTRGMAVTAEIRKGHPQLAPLSASATDQPLVLSGMGAHFLEDGSLAVQWYASGRCSGGTKDLTLSDGKNYIPASGACLFDPSIANGYPSYYATVYIDEVPLYNISSGSGYYQGWPGDLYGSIKVCGGFSTTKGSSNSACAYVSY